MFEKVVLSNLILNEAFARKAFPFLKKEYFRTIPEKIVFELIADYTGRYAAFPSREALAIDLSNRSNINEEHFEECKHIIQDMTVDTSTGYDWLINRTEQFCKDKAVDNAVRESIRILNENEQRGGIPKLLSDALAVSFDDHIGHDFLNDAQLRFDFYHRAEEKIRFDIDILNTITNGGVGRKWLALIIAGVGVGKSLSLTHFASHNLSDGHNVLYITLEMGEEYIAQRIDANLLDVSIDDLKRMPQDDYLRRVQSLRRRTPGRLIIKEYPTSAASVMHFRHLLDELRIKKNFAPDIIYVDYLNICASSRVKFNGTVNSYTYFKMISEELRGLGVEYNVPIFTATQFNRSGARGTDPTMQDSSDSYGVPMSADLMLAAIRTEELDSLNQIMFKQVKNRYGDENIFKRFVLGIDKAKMRLYNVANPTENILGGAASPTPPGRDENSFIVDEPTITSFEDFARF